MLELFERRRLVAVAALEVVVLDFGVAQLQLHGSLRLAEGGDLLLERVLGIAGLGLALLVLGLRLGVSDGYGTACGGGVWPYLPLVDFEAEPLNLLLQLALALLALLNVLLELGLELLAGGLELLQLHLQRLVLALVVGQLVVGAAALAPRGRRGSVGHGGGAVVRVRRQYLGRVDASVAVRGAPGARDGEKGGGAAQ